LESSKKKLSLIAELILIEGDFKYLIPRNATSGYWDIGRQSPAGLFFSAQAVTQTSDSTEPSEGNYKNYPEHPPSLITSFSYSRGKKILMEARKVQTWCIVGLWSK
jgi:hypothetical protein